MLDLINEIMGMGISVHVAMNEMDQIEARNKNVEWVCGQVTVTTSLGYVSQRNLLLKRLMDIAGGLVGCLITAVLTVIIGPMIYAASPGPIFFSQIRIGENGRKFRLFKFRSMYMDAEKRKQELVAAQGLEDQMMFKMEHDPRIIGQKQRPDGTWKKGNGGIIRDFSLDEFPQFFNMLKGDMSMVGTRPPTVDEWDRYEPYHRGRMSTKPGITGLWQISGRSKITDFDKVVQLDREYIEEWVAAEHKYSDDDVYLPALHDNLDGQREPSSRSIRRLFFGLFLLYGHEQALKHVQVQPRGLVPRLIPRLWCSHGTRSRGCTGCFIVPGSRTRQLPPLWSSRLFRHHKPPSAPG